MLKFPFPQRLMLNREPLFIFAAFSTYSIMRLLLFFFLIVPFYSFAQRGIMPFDSARKMVVYSERIQTPGVSKAGLHSKAEEWMISETNLRDDSWIRDAKNKDTVSGVFSSFTANGYSRIVFVLSVCVNYGNYVAEVSEIGYSQVENGKCTYLKAEDVYKWNNSKESKKYAEATEKEVQYIFARLRKKMTEEED